MNENDVRIGNSMANSLQNSKENPVKLPCTFRSNYLFIFEQVANFDNREEEKNNKKKRNQSKPRSFFITK